jgi:cytochrome P450
MAQAQAEIGHVLGEQPPTPQNVGGLSVLDQIVKESLRLYPPIHVGNRFAAQDVELAGYHIPAGTRVMVSYYLVQRHPDFWDAPDEFRPERWAGGFRPAPFSYLPFGGGPRNCIGGAFAQLEARLVLARILQRFDLVGHGRKARAHMGATLEPHPGVPMRARRRA